MRKLTQALWIVLSAIVLATSAIQPVTAAPGDNSVVHWNEVAASTVLASGARSTPSAAALYMAIVQAAVYDAVMAIEGTHQPYAYDGYAPGASVDAAVATAGHDVLAYYFPGPGVDAAYTDAMSAIPPGAAKDKGTQVGHASAAALIALRTGDGRDAPAPPPNGFDGTEPGEWRRTNMSAAPVTPYVANVTPFLMESPEQFRPAGPLPLDSYEYFVEFERTRLFGARFNSQRTPQQTEIATFWTENTVGQYNRALRSLATERDLSTGKSALLFAMTDIPAADAMITCWNSKYHYLAWRPVTAIPQADSDGNPWTQADPTWQPLSATANHPEYTSGHACLTGAISRGLEEFLGTKRIELTMTFVNSSGATVSTHHFPTVKALCTEVEDARVYGGDHWTTGGTDGTRAGDNLAKSALKRFFREA